MIRVTFTQHSGKRHRQQQDALWNGHGRVQEPDVPITSLLLPGGRVLLAIADGVAVSPFPHLASRFVVETLAVVARPSGLSVKAVRDLHQRLCERYAKGNTRGASATLVAAEFSADTCRIVNAGDSRAYLITDCGHWSQLSRDHSILNDLIESGEADADTEYARIYGGLAHCLTADFEDHGQCNVPGRPSPAPLLRRRARSPWRPFAAPLRSRCRFQRTSEDVAPRRAGRRCSRQLLHHPRRTLA